MLGGRVVGECWAAEKEWGRGELRPRVVIAPTTLLQVGEGLLEGGERGVGLLISDRRSGMSKGFDLGESSKFVVWLPSLPVPNRECAIQRQWKGGRQRRCLFRKRIVESSGSSEIVVSRRNRRDAVRGRLSKRLGVERWQRLIITETVGGAK